MWTQWDGTASLAHVTEKDRRIAQQRLSVPFVHVGRDDADVIRTALLERESKVATSKAIRPNRAPTSNGAAADADTPSSPSKTVAALTPFNISALEAADGSFDFHVFLSSSDSPNQWQEAFGSLYFTIFFQVMLGCLHIIVFLAAVAKFKRYYQLRSSRPFYAKIPLVCLAFLIAGNLERGLYCFLDPMGAFHIVPRGYRRVLISLSIPWTYASTLLLTFFWSEAIDTFRVPKTPKPIHATGEGEAELEGPITTKAKLTQPTAVELGKVVSPHRSAKKSRVYRPKRASKLLSIGQYQEPFHLGGPSEDASDAEYEMEEYVDRGDHHFVDGADDDCKHDEALPQKLIVEVDDSSSVPTHLLSSSSPSPPPPPPSPPAIPAPSVPLLLQSIHVPNGHLAGLRAEPLYIHLPLTNANMCRSLNMDHPHVRPQPSPTSQQMLLQMPSAKSLDRANSQPQSNRKGVYNSLPASSCGIPANSSGVSQPTSKPRPAKVQVQTQKSTHSSSSSSTPALAGNSHHQFLQKYQVPFIVSTIMLTLLDLTFSILDSMYIIDWQLLPLVEVLFAVIGIVIGTMYFYISYKVIQQFKLDAAGRIKSAEYNAAQCEDVMNSVVVVPTPTPSSPLRTIGEQSPNGPQQHRTAYQPLGTATPGNGLQSIYKFPLTAVTPPTSATPVVTSVNHDHFHPPRHASYLIGDITRSHHDRMVRMSQFLVGSAFGLLLFLGVTLASPQLWKTEAQSALDDPIMTICREILTFLALFIIGACQICAF